jgi:metal-dependent amidase/aminoacylase/carboxypeptidase family protein
VGNIHGGTSYNVIAKDAWLEGSVRALSEETRVFLLNKIEKTAKSVAAEHGAAAETEFENFALVLKNDPEVFEEVYQAAEKTVGKNQVLTDKGVIMGFTADDFSQYLPDIKGAYAHIGVRNDNPNSQLPLHSENLEPDENAVLIGAELHVRYVCSMSGISLDK